MLNLPLLNETHMSPDGKRFVSIEHSDGSVSWDLFLYDLSGARTRLTTDTSPKQTPTWSYDGTSIYYSVWVLGDNVVTRRGISSGVSTPLRMAGVCNSSLGQVSESATGRIVYVSNIPVGDTCAGEGIFTARSDGSGITQVVAPSNKGLIQSPVWSPDEKQIAFGRHSEFAADNSFVTTINLMNPDGSNLRTIATMQSSQQIGILTEDFPICWSADGTRILFTNQELEKTLISTACVPTELS
jgi:Tol biopolymer transport system component